MNRITIGTVTSQVELDPAAFGRVALALSAPEIDPEKPPGLICLLKLLKMGEVGVRPPVGAIPTGLVPMILPLCEPYTLVSPWTFAGSLIDPTMALNGLTLRPDQIAALTEIAESKLPNGDWFPRGIIQSCTASGKTAMEAVCAKSWPGTVLVVAPDKQLAWQLQETLKALTGESVGLWQAATEVTERITVATIQTLMEASDEMLRPWGMVLLDEVHHYSTGEVFRQTIERCVNATARIGFSGTPWRKDKQLAGLYVQGLCGPVIHEFSAGEAIDAGILPPVTVTYVPTRIPSYAILPNRSRVFLLSLPWKRRDRWDAFSYAIVENQERNNLIVASAKLAVATGKQTLVLTTSLRHGSNLAADIGCPFTSGKDPDQTRQALLHEFQGRRLPCLVASTVLDEGKNIEGIECLILAGGGKSPIALLQRIGRAMRAAEGKTQVQIIDFLDQFNVITYRHSRERQRICRDAGFLVREAA